MAYRCDLQTALVTAAALCGGLFISAPAGAIVIPLAQLYSTSVPANGVLRFSITEGVTVRILAADGSEVPGSFIAEGVWRPHAPFTEGTYTADVTWEQSPAWARDATFEVTPAVGAASELVHVQVTSRTDADGDRVIIEECCLAGVARPPYPCDGVCPPLCVPTKYEAKQTVSVVALLANDTLDWQIDTRDAPTEAEGEFTKGFWDVEGEPEQLCGVIEVFSWIDESTTTLRSCIPNPKPALVPFEEPVTGFGTTSECTIPPAGFEPLWCEERAYICTDWRYTTEGSMNDEVLRACEHYDQVCDIERPAAPATTDSTAIAAPSAENTSEASVSPGVSHSEQGDEPGLDRNDGEPQLRSIEPREGCAVTQASPERGTLSALLGIVGWCCGLVWRRRFRGAPPSRS